MKKLNYYSILFCAVSASILASCDPSEEAPKGKFETGVFVLNEGNYAPANGTITYFNPTTKEAQQSIFESTNSSKKLAVVQSATLNGDIAYIILNNGDKIQVVNSNTFKDDGIISGDAIVTPRYMTVMGDKGYLSVWGPYDESYNLIDSYVLVLDLKTKSIIDTIDTDEGSENSVAYNNKLYVSNSTSGNLSVVDPSKTKDQVIKTIEVGTSPGELVVDSGNKLWVICGGGYDENYDPLNNGALYCINTTTYEIEKTIELNMNVTGKMVLNKTKDKLFFFKGNKIYAVSTSATTIPDAPFITETGANFHGIGFDNENELIYAGNNKGYTINGNVFRYKTDGTKVDNFDCGIAPNGFIFR